MTEFEFNFDDLDGVDYAEVVEDIAWRDRMRREYWIEEYNYNYLDQCFG